VSFSLKPSIIGDFREDTDYVSHDSLFEVIFPRGSRKLIIKFLGASQKGVYFIRVQLWDNDVKRVSTFLHLTITVENGPPVVSDSVPIQTTFVSRPNGVAKLNIYTKEEYEKHDLDLFFVTNTEKRTSLQKFFSEDDDEDTMPNVPVGAVTFKANTNDANGDRFVAILGLTEDHGDTPDEVPFYSEYTYLFKIGTMPIKKQTVRVPIGTRAAFNIATPPDGQLVGMSVVQMPAGIPAIVSTALTGAGWDLQFQPATAKGTYTFKVQVHALWDTYMFKGTLVVGSICKGRSSSCNKRVRSKRCCKNLLCIKKKVRVKKKMVVRNKCDQCRGKGKICGKFIGSCCTGLRCRKTKKKKKKKFISRCKPS